MAVLYITVLYRTGKLCRAQTSAQDVGFLQAARHLAAVQSRELDAAIAEHARQEAWEAYALPAIRDPSLEALVSSTVELPYCMGYSSSTLGSYCTVLYSRARATVELSYGT